MHEGHSSQTQGGDAEHYVAVVKETGSAANDGQHRNDDCYKATEFLKMFQRNSLKTNINRAMVTIMMHASPSLILSVCHPSWFGVKRAI